MRRKPIKWISFITGIDHSIRKQAVKRLKYKEHEDAVVKTLKRKVTLAEAEQRLKFGMVMSFLAKIREPINITFQNKINSALNKAAQVNFRHAIVGQYPDFEINYPGVVISAGRLVDVYNLKLQVSAVGVAKLSWENFDYNHDLDNDQLFVLVFDATIGKTLYARYSGFRNDRQTVIDLPSFDYRDELHCWVFLKSITNKHFSGSVYAEEITIGD